jgi:ABC-type oligopeptide transport system substrate-binding subunit
MKRGGVLLALAAAAIVLGLSASPGHGAGETITVEDSTPQKSLDPQTDPGFLNTLPIHFVTCEGLYAYPDRSGAAGMVAQPDVSAGPPTVNGLTYTFTVRSGFQFSNGDTVTAQSFVDAITRLRGPVGQANGNNTLVADIASATANGSQLTIVLSGTPTSSLLDRLAQYQFCPVPPGTPPDTVQPDTMPTDGPYYVADASGGAWTITQNPHYGGSRIRNLGTIVWHYGVDQFHPGTAANDALSGATDYAPNVPLDSTSNTTYGATSPAAAGGHQQYFLNNSPIVGMVVFNTRSGRPLADETTRREVACAIAADRTNYASQVGGLGAVPVDDFILPGFPGSGPASPCTGVGPPPSGLVLSGLFRHTGPQGPTAAGLLQSELGQGVTLNQLQYSDPFFDELSNPASWDVAVFGVGPSNTDPGAFLASLFGTNGDQNVGGFSDNTIDTDVATAEAMPLGPDRDAAFANVDAEIAAAAPAVAEYAFPRADAFSPRIGCQVYQPIYGMNLNLLCVRVADTSVAPGGSVITGTEASPAAPLQTGVTTPTGGSVSIQQGVTTATTSGYTLLSQQLVISAPPTNDPTNPLRLTFSLDASVLNGADPSTVDVFRDGAVIPACDDQSGTASPDPCVLSRTVLSGGDVQITVLSSHASTWNFALLPASAYAAAVIDRVGHLGLANGTAQSLLAKLNAFRSDAHATACSDLTSLASAIRAQAGKKIPTAAANELLADVAQLRTLSHC